MWKTIAAAAVGAAVIGGAGTVAYASSGTAADPAPAPSSPSASADTAGNPPTAATGKRAAFNRRNRALHGTWVTQNRKTSQITTHDAIRGQVSVVSPTTITVRAADNLTETYLITSSTKVFTRTVRTATSTTPPPRTASSISEVKAGDSVVVAGTGTTTLTAARIVDVKK